MSKKAKTKGPVITHRDGLGEPIKRRTVVANPSKSVYTNTDWWNQPENQTHDSLFSMIDVLANRHKNRQLKFMYYSYLYQGQNMLSFRPGSTLLVSNDDMFTNVDLSFNVIKSCVDTLSAKIAKNDPQIMFTSQDGTYEQKQRCRGMTQFLQGCFYANNTYQISKDVFRDALVFGMGILYLYPDYENKTIACERVIPDEIEVDEYSCLDGNPTNISRKKYVSKSYLIEQHPEFEKEISSGQPVKLPGSDGKIAQDIVLVAEGWKLPVNGKPGRYTQAIGGCTLIDEEYHKDHFPFVFFYWDKPLDGFYGLGLVQTLEPTQDEITITMTTIQLALHYFAVPRIVYEQSSQINIGHLNNMIDGQAISYVGTKPELWSPGQILSGEVYKWLDDLIEKAYNATGVSQLSANAEKPAGLDSGAALRSYHDIATERFIITGQKWEKFYVDVANQTVELAAEMYSQGTNLTYKTPGNKWLKKQDWKSVNMKKDLYTIQAFPIDMIPQTPAGKMQTIGEYVKAGWVDGSIGMALMRIPDLDSAVSDAVASLDLASYQCYLITEKLTMPKLNPNQDLQIALKVAMQTSVRLDTQEETPDEVKDLLQTFINKIKDKLAPPPAAPSPAGGSPLGVPQQPETSDLLPVKTAGAPVGAAPPGMSASAPPPQ